MRRTNNALEPPRASQDRMRAAVTSPMDGAAMHHTPSHSSLQTLAKGLLVDLLRHHDGPGPGAQVHMPLHVGRPGDTVRVTEGELKADVVTVLSGVLTISIPGVSSWHQAYPMLQDLQPAGVLLAFDTDWRHNPHVARALGQAAFGLVKAGYAVEVEDWDISQGKGIDDVLAAGHTPHRKPVALAFGAMLRGQARHWTAPLRTMPVEEVGPWHSRP